MNKILYISYDGLTDPLGQSQILAYLSKIANDNVQIDIVSFDKKINFNANHATIEDCIKNININWYPLFYSKYPPIFSTLWDISKGFIKISKLFAKIILDKYLIYIHSIW